VNEPEITCREFIAFIVDYLDGELAPHQWSLFEAHIDVCPDCVHYLESYRATSLLAAQAMTQPSAPVPEDVPEDLVTAVLAARRARESE
jgi:anti-sigma factor RsiW